MEFRNGFFAVFFTLFISFRVSFAQEPHLILMPESILKNLGESVLVACTASVPNPDLVTSMEWKGPGGVTIPFEDDSITTLEGLGGDNQLDLLINKLREGDVGNYSCFANYAGNQKLTQTIHVQYFRDIDFGDTETLQTPVLNSVAKIRCVVTSDPAPLVDWLKDGLPLKADSRIIQQSDGIMIKRITGQDEGVYRCRARVQSLGKIKFKDIQVEVHVPPEITGPPKDTLGVEKESVALQCNATGKPSPVHTWVNKDSEILNKKEGYSVDEITGELRIYDLRPDQAGIYRCTAENAAGEDFAEATLRVLTKPKIEQHQNITTAAGGDAEMRCLLSGDPLPKAVFQKETNAEPFEEGVDEGGRIEVRQSIDDQGRRVGSLLISEVDRKDDGLYTCSGISTGGITVSWGHITVEFEPTFEDETQDEFWSWEQKPVNLTCLATSIPNATIQWFLREQPIREEDPNLEVQSRGPNGVLRVHPLDGSYFDTYTCRATNTLGVASHEVALRQVQKPGPVSSTRVDKKTSTTVSFAVHDPLNDGGLPVLGFTVQYRLSDTSWDKAEQNFWSKGSSYVVDHLTPQATYVFRFAARNDVGDGEWSGEKSEEMPQRSSPEEPLIFNINDNGTKSIPYTDHYDLQWQVPLDNGEPITSFKIVYYEARAKSGGWEAIGTKQESQVPYPGKSSYRIEGLNPDTNYKIELRAYNQLGYSTPAEAVIKTAYASVNPDASSTEETNGGVVAAIIIIVILIVLILVDVILFFAKGVGVTAFVVRKLATGQAEKDKEAMIEEGKISSKTNPDDISSKGKVVTEIKEKDVNETTPMIMGSNETDKEAIKKEESKGDSEQVTAKENAAAVNEGLTKDSSV